MLKIKPSKDDELNEAIELVLDLAFQNVIDKFDNPSEYRRQMKAVTLVADTFLPGRRYWK